MVFVVFMHCLWGCLSDGGVLARTNKHVSNVHRLHLENPSVGSLCCWRPHDITPGQCVVSYMLTVRAVVFRMIRSAEFGTHTTQAHRLRGSVDLRRRE